MEAKHSGLVDELYQAEVLRGEEKDSINSEVTSTAQNQKLLAVLGRKNKDQFDEFLVALDNTGQQHVRNHITGRQRQFFCNRITNFQIGFASHIPRTTFEINFSV